MSYVFRYPVTSVRVIDCPYDSKQTCANITIGLIDCMPELYVVTIGWYVVYIPHQTALIADI